MSATKKIALLSNVTVDLVVAKLRNRFQFYTPEGYDAWAMEALNRTAPLYAEKLDAIVIMLDGTEARAWKSYGEALERVDAWKTATRALIENTSEIPVFITTVDFRVNRIRTLAERSRRTELENAWYQFVQELAETTGRVYALDLADAIADLGRERFYSNKMWYLSGSPYSRDGLAVVARELTRALDAAFAQRKKIIALDLDNTLWGGVVGEDGLEGIQLAEHQEGQRYYDFQRQALEMQKRGILLAVVSKNNEDDAMNALENHPAMPLRPENFVAKKINWENKARNLQEMARELKLTEGSFIFVDDNPVEREIVANELPDVDVPPFPDSTELLPFAESLWFDYCRPLRALEEDRNKTQMYQAEAARTKAREASVSLEDFLAKLQITVEIHRMRDDELERVAQLCGKTNQFNLTTIRYSQSELAELANRPDCAIYTVRSADKYGDAGLIAVLILREEEDRALRVDSFLMSCRVMGRTIENVVVNEIANRYRDHKLIRARFIPTAKNAPVKDLCERLGFELVNERDGVKEYALKLENYEYREFAQFDSIQFTS